MDKTLIVKDLNISFNSSKELIKIIRGVDFSIGSKETLCLVGESGSGKSVTAQSIMGLLPEKCQLSGSINFLGQELNSPSAPWKKIRGQEVSMVFQNPFKALNPTMTIGKQVGEGLIIHQGYSQKEAKKKVLEFLDLMRIPQVQRRFSQYPFEFSGGMLQRVMIAVAVICQPKLLIADEPTTALDVTLQLEILELLQNVQKELDMAMLFITHDFGVVSQVANRVAVMYAGQIVETASIKDIFRTPQHPYTQALLNSLPYQPNGELRKKLEAIVGSPPDLHQDIIGCAFANRCKEAMNICVERKPEVINHSVEHNSFCWRNWRDNA